MFKVPILLIIYNRVNETHNLFQVLRKIAPEKFYVAADGANTAADKLDYINCLKARSVIMPEWKCELHTNFKDEHIGKNDMIYQAMQWFFDNEPEGIILFEDVMPNPDFFSYCEELLNRYRDQKEVMHIGANYFKKKEQRKFMRRQKKTKSNEPSYYFSAYANLWGFATWKDRWKNFTNKMTELDGINFNKLLNNYMDTTKERFFWLNRYNILSKHGLQSFDNQYNFHIWYKKGLAITPHVNLVANTGFKNQRFRIRRLQRKTFPIMPLIHPAVIQQDKKADHYLFMRVYKRVYLKQFVAWFNSNIIGKEMMDF
jgi:hypothetical protein